MDEPNKINFNLSEFVSIMLQYFSYIDEYAKKINEEKIDNKIFIKEGNDILQKLIIYQRNYLQI
jgi:hypothetical protein